MGWAKKRQFPRYAPEEFTFAVLHHDGSKIGQIVSVSKGGLAFEYYPHSCAGEDGTRPSGPNLDIIVGRAPLYVAQIPCDVLYDFTMPSERFLSARIAKRCCGLKFKELTKPQREVVEILLRKFVLLPEETAATSVPRT